MSGKRDNSIERNVININVTLCTVSLYIVFQTFAVLFITFYRTKSYNNFFMRVYVVIRINNCTYIIALKILYVMEIYIRTAFKVSSKEFLFGSFEVWNIPVAKVN